MRAVLQSVSAISTALGCASIAEGVESDASAEQVGMLDYGYAQGFLYSRPLALEAVEALFRAGHLRPLAIEPSS